MINLVALTAVIGLMTLVGVLGLYAAGITVATLGVVAKCYERAKDLVNRR